MSGCAGAGWSRAHTHLRLGRALLLHPSLQLCSPELPGTVTNAQRGRDGRGSQEDRKRQMVTWKGRGCLVKSFVLEAGGAMDFQVRWPGAQEAAAPSSPRVRAGLS